MKKRRFRVLTICLLVCVLVLAGTGTAFAYYNLPAAEITPSQGSVSLTSGQTQTIGMSVSPSQEAQLPGCGMAECPDSCPPECIGAGGWCQCAGSSFETKYTQVSVSSSDSSVAQASYSGGALTVKGESPGSATITVTADLAKHQTSKPVYVDVTVSAPAAPPPDTGGGSSTETNTTTTTTGGSSSQNTTGKTEVGGNSGTGAAAPGASSTSKSAVGAAVGQADAQGSEQEPTAVPAAPTAPKAVFTMAGRDGVDYTVVTLGLGAKLPAVLSDAAGRNEKVVIQQKDVAGNVAFSLSFLGAGIEASAAEAFGGSLEGALTDTLPEGVSAAGDAVALRFEDHAALPAPAEAYVAAGTHFAQQPDGIDVYQVNPDSGDVTKIAQGGSVVNGYIIFDLENTNDVILASGALTAPGLAAADSNTGGGASGIPILPIAIAAAAVAAALIAVFARRAKVAAAAATAASVMEQGAGDDFPAAPDAVPDAAPDDQWIKDLRPHD
jgi:hypothetical protein